MAVKAPRIQYPDRVGNQGQQNFGASIDQLVKNPLNSYNILNDNSAVGNPSSNHNGLTLAAGDNVINHGLGRDLLGWIIIRCDGAQTFYDKQSTNTTPQRTLILNASGAVTVTIYVF